MFPPPSPWKQIAAIDPDREYIAFTSRFFLRSLLVLPRFLGQSAGIQKQLIAAPGVVGWSLSGDLFRLELHTLSAWEDAASLQRFAHGGAHAGSVKKLENDTRRSSIFVRYKVRGRDLPLRWDDAIARQEAHEEARRGRDS